MNVKKERQIHLKMENVAIPEVKICDYEDVETVDGAVDKETMIDYTGAVPEVHLRKKEK